MPAPLRASILVVDDSSTQRTIIKDMLARLGFRHVDEAEDGQTALAKMHGRGYSLIICDWHMEPMSGIALLREVRRVRSPNRGRFILTTTAASWGSQTTARLDGADGFLAKPFGIDALKAKVDSVLASSVVRS